MPCEDTVVKRALVAACALSVLTACGSAGGPDPAVGLAATTLSHETAKQSTPTTSPASATTAGALPTPGVTPPRDKATSTALQLLATLSVKGRAAKTGYSRAAFGPAWTDVDRNGCDTRNDILKRDLSNKTYKVGTRDCVVLTGVLADPYTGTTIAFQRGQTTSTAVQIDHVVALSDTWQTGAARLSFAVRESMANDPLELLAVDGHSNESKGDGDAATWLPPSKPYRCAYVARQVAVKAKYGLWVTGPEKAAIVKVLDTCVAQRAPSTAKASPPSDPSAGRPPPEPSAAVPASVIYANCDAVRRAGAAPLRAGEPGYSRTLDRDGDGVACE
jgi:Excalibur calcium-binding domain/Protein of unknown function (DUF1524)